MIVRTLYSAGNAGHEFLTVTGKSQADIDHAAARLAQRTDACVVVLVRVGTYHKPDCDDGTGYERHEGASE